MGWKFLSASWKFQVLVGGFKWELEVSGGRWRFYVRVKGFRYELKVSVGSWRFQVRFECFRQGSEVPASLAWKVWSCIIWQRKADKTTDGFYVLLGVRLSLPSGRMLL